jgi:hypothetical protein
MPRRKQKKKKSKAAAVGKDGRFELGSRIVDDPLEPGQRAAVAINVRESAIEHLASHKRINAAQAAAGDRFRRLWEQAAIGAVKATDPTKDAIDSSCTADPITDTLMRASSELKRATQAIGLVGSRILVSIIEHGSIEKAAREWARMGGIVKGRRAEGYVTGTLVDALDGLVNHWRLEGRGNPPIEQRYYKRAGQKVVVYDDIVASGPISETGPSFEISVGRFGDIERKEIRPVDRGPLTMQHAGSAEVASGKRMRRHRPPKNP